jgi:transcriptional repressor NrdR
LRCPSCDADNDKVIDSRPGEDGSAIRRRRECLACGKRYTTYERVERAARLTVVKRDGARVPFDAEKLMRGLQAACGKRPIAQEAKERLVQSLDEELHRAFDREVESAEIGRRLAARLRDLDPIAYVRFASEHYGFASIEEFAAEMVALQNRPVRLPNERDLFPPARPEKD